MKAKTWVGIALAIFCTFLIVVYFMGFIVYKNTTDTQTLQAITNKNNTLQVVASTPEPVQTETSNTTLSSTQNQLPPTQVTPTPTPTTIPVCVNCGRRSRAS